MNKLFKYITAFGLMILVLTGCAAPKQHNGKIKVVSTLNFYGEVATQVGGKYVDVDTIIKSSSMDPHEFEPTTNTAKQVSQADLVIMNGVGYDSWMLRLLSATSNVKQIEIAKLLHKKEGANPHLWYVPETMTKLADRTAREYGQIQPKHKEYFLKQAALYKKQIQKVNEQYRVLKKNVKGNRQVDVTEPVYNYTLTALGYMVHNPKFALAMENGTEPAPNQIRSMQNDIKQHRIKFFVFNKQTSSPVINDLVTLAEKHSVPVVKVTETKPSNETYPNWILNQLKQVKAVQDGGK
ncbi:zinc ABC transporter substrate-binding protein [Pediococcus argentinicus]|uniref:metal ABC transporter solute-binding protein, Zn/Mn family n=1 Tax=Pediococcus argentinicus TaxID=480391 RepID=UPI00338F60CF